MYACMRVCMACVHACPHVRMCMCVYNRYETRGNAKIFSKKKNLKKNYIIKI